MSERHLAGAEAVRAAATEDPLIDIVQLRDFGAERRIEERALARIEHLYRMKLLHIKEVDPLLL